MSPDALYAAATLVDALYWFLYTVAVLAVGAAAVVVVAALAGGGSR